MEKNKWFLSARKPLIAVSIKDVRSAKAAGSAADLVEVRLDKIIAGKKKPIDELRKMVRLINVPIIGTIRKLSDGGSWGGHQGGEKKRLELFRGIYKYVQAVDIESNSTIRNVVLEELKSEKKASIISYHDFRGTGNREEILGKIDEMLGCNADMLKLAYMAKKFEDTLELFFALSGYLGRKGIKPPISIMAMGEIGTYTRFMFPHLGSYVTYGYMENIGHKYAPGQISIQLLREIWTAFGFNASKGKKIKRPGC